MTFSGEEKIEEERREEGRTQKAREKYRYKEEENERRKRKHPPHPLVCELKSESLEGGEKMRRNAGQRTAIRIIARD